MAVIKVNNKHNIGKIKAMNGIGQPPLVGISTDYFHYLKEANIPYSRLHDVGGWFGGNMWVDVPNIFRDMDKDESDPKNYDFIWTDILIKGLIDNNCQPYFRLGVTIENFHKIKSYRITPPEDVEKWARICENIVRHYNEGWGNGFYYNIKYWEIWNEPDNSPLIEENEMWKGTKEEYFNLYRVTSKHLKKCFNDSIKIGGYASCGFYAVVEKTDEKVGATAMGTQCELNDWEKRTMGFVDFFKDFIKIVKEENLPLDFFSYHSYAQPEFTLVMQRFVEQALIANGLDNTEIHLNEWNTNPTLKDKGTLKACANALAMMCTMQNTKMNVMCYYDGAISVNPYGGLFSPLKYEPFPVYYGFKAFGELYRLGTQVECASDTHNVFALSACLNNDGKLLVVNNSDKNQDIEIDGIKIKDCRLISEGVNLENVDFADGIFSIKPYEVLLIDY